MIVIEWKHSDGFLLSTYIRIAITYQEKVGDRLAIDEL